MQVRPRMYGAQGGYTCSQQPRKTVASTGRLKTNTLKQLKAATHILDKGQDTIWQSRPAILHNIYANGQASQYRPLILCTNPHLKPYHHNIAYL